MRVPAVPTFNNRVLLCSCAGQLSSHAPWRTAEGLATGLGEEDRDYGFWKGGPEGRNRGRMGHSKTLCMTSKETCCRSSQHRNHIKGMCQPVTFFSVVHQSYDSPDAMAFWTEYVVREKWRNFCAI